MSLQPSQLELLLVHLTREEFKLLFALIFLADGAEEFDTEFDLERFSSPGWEDSDTWVEWLRRAIRYLVFEQGFEFSFLACEQNGSIHRKGDLIEPYNARYLAGLATNQVNYLDALRTAISFIERGQLTLPLEAFREAVALVQSSVEYQEQKVDPAKLKHWMELQDQALSSLDIVRKESVH